MAFEPEGYPGMPNPRSIMIDSVIEMLRSIKNSRVAVRFETHEDGACVVTVGAVEADGGNVTQSARPTAPAAAPARKSRSAPKAAKATPARSAPAPAPDAAGGIAEKILAALAAKPTGYNLKHLARAIGVRKKMKVKPVADQLVAEKKLIIKEPMGLYRRADVEVKRGRKAKSANTADKAATGAKSAAKPKRAAKAAAVAKKRGPGRPKGSRNKKKGDKATVAVEGKVEAASAAKSGAKFAKGSKRAKKTKKAAATKKTAKTAPKKVRKTKAKKKGTAEKKAGTKKAGKVLALAEKTDEAGQIAREETRRPVNEAAAE
jgi:hypothetical protein